MAGALNIIARDYLGYADARQVPWHQLRYEHVQAIRTKLGEKYKPATANRYLSALKGVHREAFLKAAKCRSLSVSVVENSHGGVASRRAPALHRTLALSNEVYFLHSGEELIQFFFKWHVFDLADSSLEHFCFHDVSPLPPRGACL